MHANVKSSGTGFCTYISVVAEIAAIVTGTAIISVVAEIAAIVTGTPLP